MSAGEIVGREDELGQLRAFLDERHPAPRVLVFEGEAGIGKSTLWLAGVEDASRRGFRVLRSRPAEAEWGLAFTGLGDLFENVLDQVLPSLSPPRRRALEIALLIEESTDAVDPRALGVAVRSALHMLAADEPVLVAVDDVQWLDPSSSSALAFALRRLDTPLAILLARRLADGIGRSAIEDALAPSGAVERLPVTSLSVGAIQTLLHARLGRIYARPTLLRIHELSGGNPFYALELGRALPVDAHPTQPLPIPETLDELVGARLAELPDDTRGALALVAALGTSSDEALRAAGVRWDMLEPALAAHVIEHDGGVIRFGHPLLASIFFQGLSAEAQRSVHRRLAALREDPIERARHLALASDAPDAAIAEALEDAASRARERGTVIAAADLAEHALRLTPTDALEDRNRRTIAAGRAHLEAGDARRARALALELADSRAGPRAEALVLLSDLEWWSNPGRAIELRREALDAAAQQPALQVEIHLRLASTLHATEGAERADEHAVTALELADALDNDSLRVTALSALAHGRFRAGSTDGMRLTEQVQLAAADAEPVVRREATMSVVHAAIWSHQLDRARTLLASIDHEWSEREELARWEVLWWLGLTELRAGRFAQAADLAERAMEIGRQYATDDRDVRGGWLVALIAAHRGEFEHARVLAESIELMAKRNPLSRLCAAAVLGHVELWSGNPDAAAARFAAADVDKRGLGVNEPAMAWWYADHAEALLALGRLDEAAALVDAWEAEAASLGREVVLAHVRRCCGLIAAAQGDLQNAVAELERAVARHEAVGDPFGRGRTLLALGIVRRRTRQKRAAREAIADAAALFEECGAERWAETARAELGRLGGRRREEGLTAAERRVAALVAEGRTNREVAAALFLGERTVETHLSHIYAKVGVRSRTELAHVYSSIT